MNIANLLVIGFTFVGILIILFLIQALSNPILFEKISSFGFFENSVKGIKNTFVVILSLGLFVFAGFFYILINIFSKKR